MEKITLSLTPQEKEIMVAYHGLNGRQKSLQELSKEHDCSREHIRFIKNCAIKKILEQVEFTTN